MPCSSYFTVALGDYSSGSSSYRAYCSISCRRRSRILYRRINTHRNRMSTTSSKAQTNRYVTSRSAPSGAILSRGYPNTDITTKYIKRKPMVILILFILSFTSYFPRNVSSVKVGFSFRKRLYFQSSICKKCLSTGSAPYREGISALPS